MLKKFESDLTGLWEQGIASKGTLYHDLRWREIISRAYHRESAYFVNLADDIIIGGFCSFRAGKRMVGLPYLPQGGMWGEFPVKELATMEKTEIINKQLRPNITDINESNYVTMKLTLPSSKDELWNTIGAKTRNLIRKSQQHNFKLITCSLEDFYKIYIKATNALGTPPHKKDFFRLILEHFGKDSRMHLLILDGIGVSSILEIDYHGCRYDMWAFSLKKYFKFNPNMFLYWEVLKSAINARMKIYDFGRSLYGQGTYHFKKQWGAQPVLINNEIWSVHGVKKLGPDRKSGIAPKIWMNLPLFAANYFGPLIRRYIV
ncbi:MAG: GNAT family N-acetyltransferase [bacterium]